LRTLDEQHEIHAGTYVKDGASLNGDAPPNFQAQHIEERMDYVQYTSRRLQAVTGVMSKRAFDLGAVPQDFEYPQLIWRESQSASRTSKRLAGLAILQRPLSVTQSMWLDNENNCRPRRYFTRSLRKQIAQQSGLPRNRIEALFQSNFGFDQGHPDFRQPSHGAMQPLADAVPFEIQSKSSIRDILLSPATHIVVSSRLCESITFCHFAPDIMTGNYENRLMAHYVTTLSRGISIEATELDA
jgi:hypothetical protein